MYNNHERQDQDLDLTTANQFFELEDNELDSIAAGAGPVSIGIGAAVGGLAGGFNYAVGLGLDRLKGKKTRFDADKLSRDTLAGAATGAFVGAITPAP